MLEKITDVPAGVDALKAVGKISKEDYENVVEPLFAEARRQGRRVRLLLQVGPEYEGFSLGVAREKNDRFSFHASGRGICPGDRHRVDPRMDTAGGLPAALASARVRQ